MTAIGQDTLKTRRTLTVDGKNYDYFSLPEAAKTLGDISRLPVSLKVLLENVLRFEDGRSYKVDDAKAIVGWLEKAQSDQGGAVQARPHPDAGFHRRARRWSTWRRCATASPGSAATRQKVNPLVPVDLVIDHSVHGRCLRQRRTRCRRTSTSSSSATASATRSCAGARRRSTISASCRPAPASATR